MGTNTTGAIDGRPSLKNEERHEMVRLTSTHGLKHHRDTRSLEGTSKPWNRKKLHKARDQVVCFRETSLLYKQLLLDDLSLNEVEVSGCLKGGISKPK